VGIGTGDATVFDPGSPGDQLNTDGNANGNDPGSTIGQGNAASGSGQGFVPVAQILAGFQAQLTAALEQADIPPSTRALIQSYFDALAEAVS
jgi:hypothetical protein